MAPPIEFFNRLSQYKIDGNHSPLTLDRDGVAIIRDSIHALCDRNETNEDILLTWMSQMLVSPETKPDKAIALVGPPGCGKGLVVSLMRCLLGRANVYETSISDFLYRRLNHRVLLTGHTARFENSRRIHQITCNGVLVGLVGRLYFGRTYRLVDQPYRLLDQPHSIRSFGVYLRMRTLEPLSSLIDAWDSTEADLKAIARILSQSDTGREMIASGLLGAWVVRNTACSTSSDLGTLVAAAVVRSMAAEFVVCSLEQSIKAQHDACLSM